MRVLIVIVVIVLGSAKAADAEKVRTNQSTKVYSRPGEQASVLLKVDSGQTMTLLEQEGRWLKVRVKGRTGYVPRSKVDMADEEDIARNTRRRPFVDGRSRKRGSDQDEGPEDRIGADAVGESEPEPKAKKASKASEEEEPAPKKKAKKPVEEEEEPAPKKKAKEEEPAPKKKAKEEDPKPKKKAVEEDAKPVVDDEKTAEPEQDSRPTAKVSKKVAVYDQPSAKSEELFMVRPNDVLYPIEKKGKWTYIENAEGDGGWVQTESLEVGNKAKAKAKAEVEAEAEADDEDEDEGGEESTPSRRVAVDIGARTGLMFITQSMRTDNSPVPTVPDNYNIPVQAVAVSLAGSLTVPIKKKYLLGADVGYDYAKTLFGGVSFDPDGPNGPMTAVVTKLTIHNFGFRALAGYDFRNASGMALFARLGFRYQGYLVDDYADPAKNPAKLPQEVVQAPTVGLGFAMPTLSSKIGLKLAVDAIFFGASVKQTAGLEDGTTPTVNAYAVGATMMYRFSKVVALQIAYDFRLMSIDFGPPVMTSTRGHMGNNVSRTDVFHLFTFGLATPF